MSESPEQADNPEVVHEESDVNVRAILWWGAGLAGVALTVLVFLWWLQGTYTHQAAREQTQRFPMAAERQNALPPGPRLQDNPQQEMRDLRTKQQSLLEGYGWVSKEAGTARIPIEEAMRIVVQRGLPTREAAK